MIEVLKELPLSVELKKYLPKDWWQDKNHLNKFFSTNLEAIYVYKNYVRYWEDIRINATYSEYRLPIDINKLFNIIFKNIFLTN